MKFIRLFTAVLFVAVVLKAAPPMAFSQEEEQDGEETEVVEVPPPAGSASSVPASSIPGQQNGETAKAPGNQGIPELTKDSTTEINVRNADLPAIIRIFSKKTKRNYILDERVKGKVSIYLPGKISTEDSIRILDSVLAYKGFAAVPIGENLWKIVPAKEARQSTIPTVTGDAANRSAAVVTRLVSLKYITAEDAKQVLGQLVSPDGFLNTYGATNSLILIDTEDHIERLLSIVRSLDVPSSDRDMTIIPIKNADAVDIAAKLSELLGLEGAKDGRADGLDLLAARASSLMGRAMPVSAQTGANAGNAAAGAASDSGSGAQSVTHQPKIIADERTNSVIVVADEDTTARVRALISQLDSKVDLSGFRFYVYRCQHAKADELADVLGGLVGQEGSGSTRNSGSTFGSNNLGSDPDLISGGRTNSSIGGGNSNRNRFGSGNNFGSGGQSRLNNDSRATGSSRARNRGSGGTRSVQLGDNFSISADTSTNSLIIFANKADYEKVLMLLEKLDIKRRQVLVEALLLEVGLSDTESRSSAFIASAGGKDGGIIAQNNGADILGLLSNPSAIQDFSIAAASSGTLTIGGGDSQITLPTQSLLLNAVQRNNNVNVLSAPTILTTDNEEAQIVVGQNVPFLASTSTDTTNLNNTFNQIDRQDVGITLRLTPQISSGNSVTLSIFTEVSNVTSVDPQLGPTTSIRTSETSVIAKDGQMIVIGGLMFDNITQDERGVPFMKDIPVLGHLFRSSNEQHDKTNLLILITPRVVADQFDARDATITRRDMIQGEIAKRDIHPDRSEILGSVDIDRVAQAEQWEGQAPTTILQPKGLDENDNIPSPQLEPSGKSDPKGPLEFSVKPKGLQPSAKQPASGGIKLTPSKSAAPSAATGGAFLVFQLTSGNDHASQLPFPLDQKKMAAIQVPAEAMASTKTFFRVGSRYSYQVGSNKVVLTAVGAFPNAAEAKTAFPTLSDEWYQLSPYEIMGLGKGPWVVAQ